jgi:hypothetical protein
VFRSPCPAGSLNVVGARLPLFALSPPLWRRRQLRRNARPGAVTAPAYAALRRAVAGHTGLGRPSERRPRPRGRGPCARTVRVGRADATGVDQAPLCIWAERGFGPEALKLIFLFSDFNQIQKFV